MVFLAATVTVHMYDIVCVCVCIHIYIFICISYSYAFQHEHEKILGRECAIKVENWVSFRERGRYRKKKRLEDSDPFHKLCTYMPQTLCLHNDMRTSHKQAQTHKHAKISDKHNTQIGGLTVRPTSEELIIPVFKIFYAHPYNTPIMCNTGTTQDSWPQHSKVSPTMLLNMYLSQCLPWYLAYSLSLSLVGLVSMVCNRMVQ